MNNKGGVNLTLVGSIYLWVVRSHLPYTMMLLLIVCYVDALKSIYRNRWYIIFFARMDWPQNLWVQPLICLSCLLMILAFPTKILLIVLLSVSQVHNLHGESNEQAPIFLKLSLVDSGGPTTIYLLLSVHCQSSSLYLQGGWWSWDRLDFIVCSLVPGSSRALVETPPVLSNFGLQEY